MNTRADARADFSGQQKESHRMHNVHMAHIAQLVRVMSAAGMPRDTINEGYLTERERTFFALECQRLGVKSRDQIVAEHAAKIRGAVS